MGTLLSIINRYIDRTGPVTALEVLRGHVTWPVCGDI